MRDVRLLMILGVLMLAIAGLSACTTDDRPEPVTLAELVAEEARLDGTVVLVEGTVRTYDDPPHSWIEDPEHHRVELFPHERVADLAGERVRVEGRFTFDPDRGRGIDVEALEVLDTPQA
ncbi:MAG: glucose-inhibited division protein B [Nitriliruptor sp.]|nr:MAG: glucose-inhibited division protein B [Nitriliruptor sp.]TVR17381.1 MAG: glucose-inhibited division protein B [Nitriliruptor sp.]